MNIGETACEILKVHIKAAEGMGKIDVALGLMDALRAISEEIQAAETEPEKKSREAAFFRAERLRRHGHARQIRAVREGPEGEVWPEFLCDVCGEPIRDFAMANMVWFRWLKRDGQTCDLYFVHKDLCYEKLELEYGNDVPASYEMSYFLELLRRRELP